MEEGPGCIERCHEAKEAIKDDFPESKGWLHAVASDAAAKKDKAQAVMRYIEGNPAPAGKPEEDRR